jgi:hypothetical protein
VRYLGMPRNREAADAIVKKIGEVMRERTADVVAEDLPEEIKKLLERLRQSTPKSLGR